MKAANNLKRSPASTPILAMKVPKVPTYSMEVNLKEKPMEKEVNIKMGKETEEARKEREQEP